MFLSLILLSLLLLNEKMKSISDFLFIIPLYEMDLLI